jgi:hypothetical protein
MLEFEVLNITFHAMQYTQRHTVNIYSWGGGGGQWVLPELEKV